MNFSESDKKIQISIGLLAAIVVAVFYAAGVYYGFKSYEQELHDQDFKLNYINERYSRKFNRSDEKIKELDERVRALEIKHGSCSE
jgi:uncharacterized protein HemX